MIRRMATGLWKLFSINSLTCLWNLHESQDSGKCSRSSQDKKDRCKSTDSFHKEFPRYRLDLDASVDKKADDQCIKYRDNSSFCRRSDTAVDTSQDNHRA